MAVALAPLRVHLMAASGPLTPSSRGLGTTELLFGGVTAFGNGAGLVVLISLLALILVATRRWREAVFVVVTCDGASLISRIAKDIYHAPRPPTLEQADAIPQTIHSEWIVLAVLLVLAIGAMRGWGRRAFMAGAIVAAVLVLHRVDDLVPTTPGLDSFPSGHALGSSTFAAALALVAWGQPRWRWRALILAISFAIAVGISRLYLGVHYPADVLAGWCLALAWTAAMWTLWTVMGWRHQAGDSDPPGPPNPIGAAPE
jgi:membrane-associated phospholipid phosphatase